MHIFRCGLGMIHGTCENKWGDVRLGGLRMPDGCVHYTGMGTATYKCSMTTRITSDSPSDV